MFVDEQMEELKKRCWWWEGGEGATNGLSGSTIPRDLYRMNNNEAKKKMPALKE